MSSILRWFGGANRVFEKLAKRYAGQVRYAHLLAHPCLTFNYGRTMGQLRLRHAGKQRGGRQTELTLGWPNEQFRLEILSPETPSRNWKSNKMMPVAVESGSMTDLTITANHPAAATELLTSSVQWQIEQLRRHTEEDRSIYVGINRGKLTVSKPGFIADYQQLDDFVRFGLELYDQLILTQSEGIDFLNEHEVAIIADVKCPICSGMVGQDMVVCLRCKTPHCFDCWEYNGQCATFACNETRFIRAGGQRAMSR